MAKKTTTPKNSPVLVELQKLLRLHGNEDVKSALLRVEEEVMYRCDTDPQLRADTYILRQVAEALGSLMPAAMLCF